MKIRITSQNSKRKINPKIWKLFLLILILLILSFSTFYLYPQFFQNTIDTNTEKPEQLITSESEESEDENEIIQDAPREEETRLNDEWLTLIPQSLEETEWLIVVDRSEQIEYIFQNRKFIKTYVVSTGSATRYSYDATLPLGIWRIGQKVDSNLTEIYGPRLMYIEKWNGTEFVKTQKALHGTNEPENLGKATSLGCIYHSNEDITELYDWIPQGTLVITVE
jgi:hypothetical protein